MTGARAFVGGDRELQFRLPACGKGRRINCCRVELADEDLYRVTFYRITKRGLNVSIIAHARGVDVDGMRAFFTRITGLALSL